MEKIELLKAIDDDYKVVYAGLSCDMQSMSCSILLKENISTSQLKFQNVAMLVYGTDIEEDTMFKSLHGLITAKSRNGVFEVTSEWAQAIGENGSPHFGDLEYINGAWTPPEYILYRYYNLRHYCVLIKDSIYLNLLATDFVYDINPKIDAHNILYHNVTKL